VRTHTHRHVPSSAQQRSSTKCTHTHTHTHTHTPQARAEQRTAEEQHKLAALVAEVDEARTKLAVAEDRAASAEVATEVCVLCVCACVKLAVAEDCVASAEVATEVRVRRVCACPPWAPHAVHPIIMFVQTHLV